MKPPTIAALALLVVLVCTPLALGQGGDTCASPQVVLGPGSVTMDTNAATSEGHHAACDPRSGTTWFNSADVWYLYTASISGLAEVSLSGCPSNLNSSTASDLSLWGACGDSSSLACARTTCSSLLTFSIDAGQSYLIRAATFASTSSATAAVRRGVATLTFAETGPPANDACAGALDVGTGTHAWNDTLATPNGPLPSCSDAPEQATQRDLWFAHTPASTGIMILTGSSLVLSVHDACGGSTLACGNGSTTITVTGGVRYLIRVSRLAGATPGAGTFTIAAYAAPSYDACSSALELGAGEFTFDDSGAGAHGPFPACGLGGTPAQRDVWFGYTAAIDGVASIDCRRAATAAPGVNTEATIAVFSSCGGGELACASSSASRRWACLPVSAGQRVLIRVSRAENSARENWTLRIREFASPAGDSCVTAQPLSLGTEVWSNAGACDVDPSDTPQACLGQDGGAYLWFVFTPPTTGVATFSTADFTVDTVFTAYDGCGGQLLDCSGNLGHNVTPGSYIATRAAAGVPIYLRVGIVGTSNLYYNPFTLTTDLVAPQVEDECPGSPVSMGTTTFDNRVATDSLSVADPTCNVGGNLGLTRHDMWWTWTSPARGVTRVSTCRNPAPLLSASTTVLTVYTDCTLATQVACNDDALDDPSNTWALPCTDEQSALAFNSLPNRTYIIRVGAHREYFGPGVLNLDFIPVPCIADFNESGDVTVQDIFDFLAAYFNNSPSADVNNSGLPVTVQDIFDFLAAYFVGCP